MDLTDSRLRGCFSGAGDFVARELQVGECGLYLYLIDGLVSGAAVAEYVLRPLSGLAPEPMAALYRRALRGEVYNTVAQDCPDLATACSKLVNGFCVVLFPGCGAVAFEVKTGEKRSISAPDVENTVKGPKDAFAETVRTNTGLLRRHLRTPDLRLTQLVVGRVSRTNVAVVWIQGITPPELVSRLVRRLERIGPDSFLTPAEVEESVTGGRITPFPLLQYTERPDRFAHGLLRGRVGLMVDGLPLAYLLPVDLGCLMSSPEDYGADELTASGIRLLRYGALLLSLLLPGVYAALAVFHQQMIPLPLLRAIIESKRSVPFSTLTEVLALLLAFELLQEAGIHLPQSIGQSVSIIGGIVVGTAAVEASFVSPAALIVVSLAGICGFALPNRDFAQGIRFWRLGLAWLGGTAGLFGVTAGVLALLIHLSGLTSLDTPYLHPFSRPGSPGILRRRFCGGRCRR